MLDLITRSRVLSNLADLEASTAEDRTLDLLIRACSRAIQKYCRRDFSLSSYDELCSGSDHSFLYLKQFPVVAVERVATDPTTVLTITNTSSSNQRATVQVTSDGLTLTRVASGTTTTDTSITWSGSVTLSAVAAAVAALGSGWAATVEPAYLLWPSSDLRAIQGALNARDAGAELELHVTELSDYRVNTAQGFLFRDSCFAWGNDNYRVIYAAGYETVPEDVQEACAEWVASLFWQTKRDPGVSQEAVPGVVSRTASLSKEGMPPQVRMLLSPYRKHRV